MKYSLIPTSLFKKQFISLIRKYPSLREEVGILQKQLEEKPDHGTSLGFDTYKIRLAIKSKRKGKSGGARVITYIVRAQMTVYLLAIYDKSDVDSIKLETIRAMIRNIHTP